ncbi:MAG: tail fiber domain-containing protein [Enterocloster asparagiformis]|nr:tail fiber domain-containing protein [Enterocloster asparagiformis]
MSYFNCPVSTGTNPDMKKVKSYLIMLNQQLQQCFQSIDPEDNFTEDSLMKYKETDENISQLEVSMSGFLSLFKSLRDDVESSIKVLNGQINLKVSAEELCSEISMTTDTITFRTGNLIIDTTNFKLRADGSAEFSGSITGGSININGRFVVTPNGTVTIQSTTFSKQITTNGLLYTNYMRIAGDADIHGSVNCGSMYASGDVSCETLYQRSDRRLKEHIEDIPDETALEIVLGLQPKTFTYKDSGQKSIGFVAQDVDALQEQIGTSLPLVDHSGDYMAIPYPNYTAILAGAVKAQQREIEVLEQRIGGTT